MSTTTLTEQENSPVPLTYYETCLMHEGIVRVFRTARAAWTPAQSPLSAPYVQLLHLSHLLCREIGQWVQKEQKQAGAKRPILIPLSLQELELVLGGLDLYRQELLVAPRQPATTGESGDASRSVPPFRTVSGKLALLDPLVKCLTAHKVEREARQQEQPEAILMALGAQLLWRERPGTDQAWVSHPVFCAFREKAEENVKAEFYIVWRNGSRQFVCRRVGKNGKVSSPMPYATPADAKAACERHHATGEWD